MIDEVLEVVCCPNCQNDLVKDEKNALNVVCCGCGSSFRMKDGVLILISQELEDELRFG